MHDAGRGIAKLGKGVPFHIRPHLGQKHIDIVFLAPVENAIEDPHLGVVPIEGLSLGLVHSLFEFHADKIHAQPRCMPIELIPGRFIFGRWIASPSAAAVVAGWKNRVVSGRYRFFDGVPRSPDAAAHGVYRRRRVDRNADLGGLKQADREN